ncbi:uncharacterized protein EDB91DRAFT_1253344 [Suillus paluster]|uniref:uncharacterized protein n=1 Tax=Suillus paluster TaxID=48578 RepID=UPI001B87B746|nr:uncharacterized protein EDB91DRAFT_1253344 [Suillus paluster]KAG1728746.1 hypothetical protein EDB91DRAFT_1253344 [Suillus paluster]
MPHTSAPVNAFYRADGPPQQLPSLMYHTEMLYPTASFILISPQEEMAFSTHTLRGHIHTPSRVFTTTSFCATTPIPVCGSTPKVTKSVSFLADKVSQNGEPEQMSMWSSILSTESNDSKIPKPEGEAGRPGRGGYNLEKALNWDADQFKKLREHCHQSINKYCDTSKSKTNQTPNALTSVESETMPISIRLDDHLIEMSRLMAFFPPHPDEDPTDSAVKSCSLQELHPVHTYPPTPQPASTVIHTRPLEPTSLGEDFTMALYKLLVALHRMREEEDECPNKVVLKETDHSSGLRDDVRELRYSYHDLLLRKHHVQMDAHSHESEMQSVIRQYHDKNAYLECDKVEALTSLERQHRNEVTAIQNWLALDFDEAQNAAHVEQDNVLAEKDALYQCEILVAREKQCADNEMELVRLAAEYGSKIASLNNQIRQATLVGKRPAVTCPNILGFSPIPDVRSESLADEEPQTSTSGNAGCPLTSPLADVLIEHAMVGMLAEALVKALQVQQTPSPCGPRSRRKITDPPVEYFTNAQHRENKANVWDLFKEVFHFTKDDEYMLHEGASCETISSFIGDMGPGLDLLALQWDMTTTHKRGTTGPDGPSTQSGVISHTNVINATGAGEKPILRSLVMALVRLCDKWEIV